jgi:energy-coupling factor transporter ATP-binding protein EcfA2
MISIQNFSYHYPTSDANVLADINLSIDQGEFVSIIGPNGSGKSTLAYALSGFIPHFYRGISQGTAHFRGQSISELSLGQLSGEIGLLVQNPFNQITGAKYTVREEIAFGMENIGVAPAEMERRIKELLALVGLEDEAQRSPFALSGGQQQRLALAAVLAMQPALLILDEPTSQLDPHATRAVFEALASLIEQGNTTVVLIEHKFEWVAQFADRVVLLDHGQIVAEGSPSSVFSSAALPKSGLEVPQYAQIAQALTAAKLKESPKHYPLTLEAATEFMR